jgi:hypothetical protein
MKKVFVILISFVILLLFGCQKQVKNDISKKLNLPSIVNSLSWDEFLISLSSNRIRWMSDKWPLTLSWSWWIDPDYLKFKKLSKYYYSWCDDKKIVFYDEYAWRRAGFVVYILRDILNKKNVALYIPNYKQLRHCKDCISLNITWDFNINFSWWAIWTGKFWIVYDPTKITFTNRDLLLYVSDAGTMKDDSFYKKFSWNVANFYWSYLVDVNWKLKPKQEVWKLLKKKWINFYNYDKIYLYYPKYWRRAWLPALYFSSPDLKCHQEK